MDKPSFEESLRALAARRRSSENHPAPEELVAYRAGDLTAEEVDRIQEHLTQCHECARLLLDLAEFEQLTPPQEELGPVDARDEASWQRLRTRLRDEEEPGEPRVLQHRPRPRVPLWQRPAVPWALAAGLALCVAGLGWRVGTLRSEVDKLTDPQAVRLITLESEDNVRRSGGDDAALVRAGEGVSYDLPLPFDPDAATYSLYDVEIVPASGNAPPKSTGRQSAEAGYLRVILPRAPEPGDYFFQVSGIEGEKKVPVGRYHFEVLPAE